MKTTVHVKFNDDAITIIQSFHDDASQEGELQVLLTQALFLISISFFSAQ